MVSASQYVVPGILGYNTDLKPYPYDPEKASQLLDEARKDGVPVDKEILLIGRTGFYPGVAELMEAMLNMYQSVGFNMKLKMMEQGGWNEYNRKPFPEGLYLHNSSHDNNKGDAVFTVFGKHHSKGSQASANDNTFDDLIERAQRATDAGRESLFQAAFKRLHEEVVSEVMLFHMVGYARIGKRINYKPSRKTVIEIPLADITFK